MAALPQQKLPAIVKAGHPVLRAVAHKISPDQFGSPALLQLVQTMTAVMRQAPGVGLAAPQIGVSLRAVVLEDRAEYVSLLPPELAASMDRRAFVAVAVCNPVLEPLGTISPAARPGTGEEGGAEGARWCEGCLSVPGYQGLVERYSHVRVTGQTPAGEPFERDASGWEARIWQHEVDHLNGVLYVDRMLTRSFAASPQTRDYTELLEGVPPLGPCTCCHPIDMQPRQSQQQQQQQS